MRTYTLEVTIKERDDCEPFGDQQEAVAFVKGRLSQGAFVDVISVHNVASREDGVINPSWEEIA